MFVFDNIPLLLDTNISKYTVSSINKNIYFD